MKDKDVVKIQSKFLSQKHMGHNTNLHLERLNLQENDQYHLENIVKIQVADLQLALQIYSLSDKQEKFNFEIFTLDKINQIILTQMEREVQKNSSYKISIKTSNNTKEILDLSEIMIRLVSLLDEKDKNNQENIDQDITGLLEQIKKNIDFYKQKNIAISNSIENYNLPNSKEVFRKSGQALDEFYKSLDKYTDEAKKDFQNRFNKDIINLTAQFIGKTHLPLLAHILIHKLGTNMAKNFLFNVFLGGATLGAFGITLSIIWLLVDINDFFSNSKKLKSAYEVYGAIMSIYKHLDYSLASLLNFGYTGVGNLIITQKNNFYTYYLYPNYTKFSSTFLYLFLKNNVSNFEDIFYRGTFSLDTNKETNQTYIENIFEKDNKDNNSAYIYTKKNTQFSIFSFEHLCDKNSNLTHSSAFQHLKNIFFKFDSFLFIKSSGFSSVLANDLLIQSFIVSKQQNKPRLNKTALFLTNCIHNGLPEYQVQHHIKIKLYDNKNTKKNILFLSAMYRIKKATFTRLLIDKLTDLFKKLVNYDCCNQKEQIHYLTQKLGKLIDTYGIGEVKKHCFYIKSYLIDDKKICDMNEKNFCNFIYDLCQVFISKRQIKILNDCQNSQKISLESKVEIEKIFKEIISIVSDISRLFSHFNFYEVAQLEQYQKQIEGEYKKQKQILKLFFKTKSFESKIDEQSVSNIFYKNQEIKELCFALLIKYFNIKDKNGKNLESLLEESRNEIEASDSEQILQTNNKIVYYQITIEYILSLLPLNKSFFNCLEEEYVFLFSRLIIHKLDKNNIYNFTKGYNTMINLYSLLNSNDKDFKKLSNDNNAGKIRKYIDKIIFDLSEHYTSEYCIQNIIRLISSFAVSKLEEPYTQSLPPVDLPKWLSLLSQIANSAIPHIIQAVLDKIFPVQIGSTREMRQQAVALIFALNRHTNTPYATCSQGNEYLTLPIEITQTLINADLKAIVLGGSALNSGFCVHTPSIAIFNQDARNSLRSLQETLRYFMNSQINFIGIGEKGKYIIKEAYAKLWFYLDMGKNEELEHYLRYELQTKPSYYTLDNLTNSAYIRTKLKKAKELENYDGNFVEIEGNAKGGIKFNHDFLIQLKRVAEYNYGMYKSIPTGTHEGINEGEIEQASQLNSLEKMDKSSDEYICGNLIYDEDYIPTMIDIMD